MERPIPYNAIGHGLVLTPKMGRFRPLGWNIGYAHFGAPMTLSAFLNFRISESMMITDAKSSLSERAVG